MTAEGRQFRDATVRFTDDTSARFSRVTINPDGTIDVELDQQSPTKDLAIIATAVYAPGTWVSVEPAAKRALIAHVQPDTGRATEELVADDVSEGAVDTAALEWLSKRTGVPYSANDDDCKNVLANTIPLMGIGQDRNHRYPVHVGGVQFRVVAAPSFRQAIEDARARDRDRDRDRDRVRTTSIDL